MQNKKLYIVIAVIVVIVGAGVAYATLRDKTATPADTASTPVTTGTPSAKVAAASIEDGTYYASVISVNRNPEDTTASFEPVIFLRGEEAKAAALEDVECDEIIEKCVTTLDKGYYVRKSGAPVFNAPILDDAQISLAGNLEASHADLENQVGGLFYVPVYEVVIKGGAVTTVKEVSKP